MRVLTQRIISCCKRVTVRCKENLSGTLELKESTQERTNLKEESPRHVLEFRHWRGTVVADCVVAMVRKSRKQKNRQATARRQWPQEVIARPPRPAGLL